MSSIASPRSWTPRAIPAWAPAAVAAAVYLVLAPPSADLAAQYYRADLGLVLWDNGWYGGHHMPGYSLLFPPLAHVLGPRLVGALSAVAAAWIFERLVRDTEGGRIAALWFAVATATTLISGRLTFALGLAVGLGAVLAAARGRHGWACALAALASIASPVAGAFVALAAAAWWLERPRWWPVALAAGALGPAVALAVAFPEGGSFPFVASSFWPALAASIAVGLAIPREARVVRIGIALYAVAIVASFVLATPMGGNVVRLGALFAGPVLAALAWRTNRRALVLLALPLLYWQWVAPVDDWARAVDDASVHERYYDGLLRFLGTRAAGRSAWRSRSPTTTGRRAGSRRACRWPVAGSARSTASATGSSMTVVRLRRRATTAGSTTTRCASSRSPTPRSTTRRRARPNSYATASPICTRSGTTPTGACTRSPAPARWRAARRT